ncbi:jg27138, partial [Pararge aegeria aegeria]
ILEGSHLPKSPEPVAPPPAQTDAYYSSAYEQQRRQYELQQHYNQQRPEPKQWQQDSGAEGAGGGRPYYTNNWAPEGRDDGQVKINTTPDRFSEINHKSSINQKSLT